MQCKLCNHAPIKGAVLKVHTHVYKLSVFISIFSLLLKEYLNLLRGLRLTIGRPQNLSLIGSYFLHELIYCQRLAI